MIILSVMNNRIIRLKTCHDHLDGFNKFMSNRSCQLQVVTKKLLQLKRDLLAVHEQIK